MTAQKRKSSGFITDYFQKKPKLENRGNEYIQNLQVVDPPPLPASSYTDVEQNNTVQENTYKEFNIKLNEGQQLAAQQSARKPVMILAGAGTGKTTTLLGRVCHMITEQKIPPKHILVVTFTNKAAKELQERLTNLYPAASECTIATFHSFCYQLLLRYYGALGFEKRPTVISTDAMMLKAIIHCYKWMDGMRARKGIAKYLKLAEQSSWEQIISQAKIKCPKIYQDAHEYALKATGKDVNKKQNQNTQNQAKTSQKSNSSKKPVQINAHQLEKLDFQIGGNLNQQQSSTNHIEKKSNSQSQKQKVKDQKKDKVEKQEQEEKYREDLSSVYSVELLYKLRQLLEQFIRPQGGKGKRKITEDSDQDEQNEQNTKKGLLNFNQLKRQCKRIQKDIERLKTIGETPQQALGETRYVYEFYQKYLQRICAVDFNDMIILALKLFHNNAQIVRPNRDNIPIPALICGRYKHLLVDEFQDCNRLQLELVKCMQGQRGQVTVVGDDAQAIYGFRGSYSRIFLDFQQQFSDPGTELDLKYPLEVNYRSRPVILSAGTQLIEQSIQDGSLLSKKLIPSKEDDGRKIRIWSCGTTSDEAELVAQEMLRLHEEENLPYEDMISLNRCFRYGSAGKTHEPLQIALANLQIPYTVVRDLGLFQREISLDICAYLTLICDSDQDEAFNRVINKPPRQLGQKFVDQVKNFQEKRAENAADVADGFMSLMRVSKMLQSRGDLSPSHSTAFSKFERLLWELRSLAHTQQVNIVIEEVLNMTGLFQYHKKKKAKEKEKEMQMTSQNVEVLDEESDSDGDVEVIEKQEVEEKDGTQQQSLSEQPPYREQQTQEQTRYKYDRIVDTVLQISKKFVAQWKPQMEFLDESLISEHMKQKEEDTGPKSLKLLVIDFVIDKMSFLRLEKNYGKSEAFKLLCEQIATVYKCGLPPLADFVAHAALVAREPPEADTKQQSGQGVTISTIHAAKGLEYDTVFVMRCSSGFLPTTMRMSDLPRGADIVQAEHEHLEEEKRLAHVAVTRAKERLYMTYIRILDQGFYKQNPERASVSQFVSQLEPNSEVWIQEETPTEADALEKIVEKEEQDSYRGGFVFARVLRDRQRR